MLGLAIAGALVCGFVAEGPGPAPPPHEVVAPAAAKITRDAFGVAYEVRESDDFALKWVDEAPSEAVIQLILDSLETSLVAYLGFGHELPADAATYRINVYLSSVDGVPATLEWAPGTVQVDPEGFLFIVLEKARLEPELAVPDNISQFVAHELHHVFQSSSGSFGDYQVISNRWFFEASANWAAMQVWTEAPYAWADPAYFALLSELALRTYNGPTSFPAFYHHYGAAIFLWHLTETVGDPGLIASAWNTGGDADALTWLSDELGDSVLEEELAATAARNVLWDYSGHDLLVDWVVQAGEEFPDHDPIQLHVAADGTDWVEVAPGRELQRFGYHVIELARPSTGSFEVELDLADATGISDSPLRWQLVRVRDLAGGPAYETLALAPGGGVVTIDFADDEPVTYMVLVASHDGSDGELARYALRAAPVEAGPEDAGCCSTGDGGGTGAVTLALLALALGRRRIRR